MYIDFNGTPNTVPPANTAKANFAVLKVSQTPQAKLSFKGLKVEEAIKIFEEEVGTSAAEHLKATIERVLSKKNTGMSIENGILNFEKDTFGGKLYRAIIDPLIYLPVDLVNSTFRLFKKSPGLKNAKFIDSWLGKGILKSRSDALEDFSNTMAIKHCFDLLGDATGRDKVLKESLKRFKMGVSPYTVKSERTWTRLVSGLIPAFFLANDAYNLSMYVNNNKDLAKKEKKRRFNQEVARVLITAAATFGTLGFFSKKVSSNPTSATAIIAALTFGSELIGRMLVGTPVYPLGKNGTQKYAKLQHKDKLIHDDDKKAGEQKTKKKEKSASSYALKLLGGMVIAGFLIDKHQNIKPVRKIVNNLASKYKEFFAKDYTISRKEFDVIIARLRENGFEQIAEHYEGLLNGTIENGNLTIKERIQVEREIENRIEQNLPDELITTSKELKEAQEKVRENVFRPDIIKDLGFNQNDNTDIINISGDLKDLFNKRTNVDKVKDNIINGVLALPVKFAWEVLNMPYKYVVKPLIEIPIKGRKLLVGKEAVSNNEELFRQSIEFLRKNINAPDFKEKVNKHIIDSFDNVNKSNISGADLAGSAKIAVSTVTSGFLILDNYNMVMIDSEGKEKDLAGQKAKERTLQRIVRIAYGACLIKLFNGLFKSQYDTSLLGAEAVTLGNTLITETLERKSVGLPLHESTREEIIEKDNETLNSSGLKGLYFRFMSKLTGKKPLSENKSN